MKLCLAGLGGIYKENIKYLANIPYMLESFYYIQAFQIPLIRTADLFLLDSGAFTFMNGAKGQVNWNDYIKKYVDFINKHNVKHFFELDIDSIVGYEEVKKIRARIEYETGKKSIPVWHKSRGIEEYKKLVNDYDYIAIGGFAIKHIRKSEYPQIKKMAAYAHNRGVKVHGLGFTQQDVKEYKFYSVDSTSWKSSRRFGTVCKFDGEKVRSITPKNCGTKRDLQPKIELYTLQEWIKYQKYLDRRY